MYIIAFAPVQRGKQEFLGALFLCMVADFYWSLVYDSNKLGLVCVSCQAWVVSLSRLCIGGHCLWLIGLEASFTLFLPKFKQAGGGASSNIICF